jgi:3',5'-cyclic-AMP phosphodiesterase
VAHLSLLAQISDPHIVVGPGDEAVADALSTAVRAVGGLAQPPDAVLVSGDITDDGDPRAYERARELLAPLPMPVHVLPGNHDDRAALRASFAAGGGADAPGDPVRYAVGCGELRLVVCDTTRPGRDDGRLDDDALRWLEAELAAAPDALTILAMHHPPLLTGIAPMDAIGLPVDDRAALDALVARSPQVRRITAGHAHRAAFGMLGPCPVVICPGTHMRVRFEPAGSEIAVEPGPPAFGLHLLLAGGEVVTHVQAVGAG